MKRWTALLVLVLAGCQVAPVSQAPTESQSSERSSLPTDAPPDTPTGPTAATDENAAPRPDDAATSTAAGVEVDFYAWLATRGRLPDCPASSETDQHARWYARHRRTIDEALQRAEPMLPFIRRAIDDADIAAEVVLLPVLESGYQIAARAPDGPAGLWQFTATTARDRGLRVDQSVDERLDPILATNAAIGLYRSLRERFGADPILAVAGYNMGAQALSRRLGGAPMPLGKSAINHPRFPKTTRTHIGRWVGLSCLLKHPARYGYQPPPLATRPAWTLYRLPTPMDEQLVSMLAADAATELRARNPHLKTDGPARRYALVLPQSLRASLESVHWPALAGAEVWRRSGDQGEVSIAGVGLERAAIESAVGSAVADTKVDTELQPPGTASPHIIVRRGDTLWELARNHRTTVAALAAANGLRPDQSLRPGLKLRLPDARSEATAFSAAGVAVEPVPGSYTIVSGDSLWLIAKRFGTTVERLLSLNQLSRRARLRPGQKLLLPPSRTPSSAP